MPYDEIQQMFDLAIRREVEANRFYLEISEQTSNVRVQEIFADLARQEKAHEALLTGWKHDPTAPLRFVAPPNYRVAEATAAGTPSAGMKPADAIALAMKRELEAMRFYDELAAMSSDPETRAVCASLSAMEANHKHRLEELFVEIGYPEAW
jgi:rubrerythrin